MIYVFKKGNKRFIFALADKKLLEVAQLKSYLISIKIKIEVNIIINQQNHHKRLRKIILSLKICKS